MFSDPRRRTRAIAYVPSVVGIGIVLVVVGEWIVFASLRFDLVFSSLNLVSMAINLPFVVGLLYGGYWLDRSTVTPDRYGRIALWCFGGLVVFLLMNVPSIAVFPGTDPWLVVGWLRWAAAIGAGVGLLTGVVEARAIDREIAAEGSRVRNRELRRQNDRLAEFASVVSHDLRNPLNVASGRIELAREGNESEHLSAAVRALQRMEQIVERTLTLARSGLVVDDPESVDLSELALDSWRLVETGEADLRIEDAPIVRADPDRVRHVFENLFRNSVEHGGNDVTVRVGSLAGGFFVEDDGPGIPEDEREAAFEVGYSSISDGTGFGLRIVRQIAEAHDWTIEITEGDAGGARFEFRNVEVEPASERRGVEDSPIR